MRWEMQPNRILSARCTADADDEPGLTCNSSTWLLRCTEEDGIIYVCADCGAEYDDIPMPDVTQTVN